MACSAWKALGWGAVLGLGDSMVLLANSCLSLNIQLNRVAPLGSPSCPCPQAK